MSLPRCTLLQIDDDEGNATREVEVAAARRTWVWIERGFDNPMFGYIEFVDEYIIRIANFREWRPVARDGRLAIVPRQLAAQGRFATILRDDISSMLIRTIDMRRIRRQITRENERRRLARERRRARRNAVALMAYFDEGGVWARSIRFHGGGR